MLCSIFLVVTNCLAIVLSLLSTAQVEACGGQSGEFCHLNPPMALLTHSGPADLVVNGNIVPVMHILHDLRLCLFEFSRFPTNLIN